MHFFKDFRNTILALALLGLTPVAQSLEVTLTPSVISPQPISTRVLLTAASDSLTPENIVMRFEARLLSNPDWKILQDFREKTYFEWTSLRSNTHLLRVLAVDEVSGESAVAVIPYSLASHGVVAGQPVILPTAHPQVMLYSRPPCPAGASFRVRFWPTSEAPPGQTTHFKPCPNGRGVAHYIGGMRGDTDYLFRGEVFNNGTLTGSPLITAHTGVMPDLTNNYGIVAGPDANTSPLEPIHLAAYTRGRDGDGNFMLATDLQGRALWGYGQYSPDVFRTVLFRPKYGGTFMGSWTEADGGDQQQIREIDLVGNTLRETNITAINRQLTALGVDNVGAFHHETRPLTNGHTLVLVSVERILTDIQGKGDVNVYGEMVLDLDANLQVVWTWNSFEHLDTSEMAILGETCVTGQGGCPVLQVEPANDWLHMNSIAYSPADGHFVLSARHHDTVYKINYANGTGDGSVVWRLGKDGHFAIDADPAEVWPWFSHQHDAQYQNGLFVVYDNGNVRLDQLGGPQNSRGQVYSLDETNMIATLVHNFDMGDYSVGLGSAQLLRNGNYHFDRSSLFDQTFASVEMAPNAGLSWAIAGQGAAYRSFRLKSLYEP